MSTIFAGNFLNYFLGRITMDKATEIIIELMTQRGLSARQLESSANLSNASIQAWKSGKARPSVDALVKLSDYFGVSVDFLLGHEVQEKRRPLRNDLLMILPKSLLASSAHCSRKRIL